MAESDETDPEAQGVDPHDQRKKRSLPPGSDTKGDEQSRLRGNDREAAPYDDAPADGHLAPGADNPAP